MAVLAVVYRLEGPFLLRSVDWGEARKLLGYGGWMFATNVVYPELASADQFIIGSMIGVAFRTAFPLWDPRSSRMTTSPGFSVGTRN